MEFIIETASFVMLTMVLVGVALIVKPFWLIKKRWQGLLVMLGGFVMFGVLQSLPMKRPDHIAPADWSERVQVCKEAAALRSCPTSDSEVDEARAAIAQAAEEKAQREAERERLESERTQQAQTASHTDTGEVDYNDQARQQAWIANTERAVKAQMKDPGSVRFRNSRFNVYDDKVPVVCGEINAKNGFGGHTGFQKYIASGDSFGPFLEETMSANEFAKSWNEFCVK